MPPVPGKAGLGDSVSREAPLVCAGGCPRDSTARRTEPRPDALRGGVLSPAPQSLGGKPHRAGDGQDSQPRFTVHAATAPAWSSGIAVTVGNVEGWGVGWGPPGRGRGVSINASERSQLGDCPKSCNPPDVTSALSDARSTSSATATDPRGGPGSLLGAVRRDVCVWGVATPRMHRRQQLALCSLAVCSAAGHPEAPQCEEGDPPRAPSRRLSSSPRGEALRRRHPHGAARAGQATPPGPGRRPALSGGCSSFRARGPPRPGSWPTSAPRPLGRPQEPKQARVSGGFPGSTGPETPRRRRSEGQGQRAPRAQLSLGRCGFLTFPPSGRGLPGAGTGPSPRQLPNPTPTRGERVLEPQTWLCAIRGGGSLLFARKLL